MNENTEYKKILEWLFSQLPMYQRQGKAAYKANLKNTLALDEHFGHPHQQFKSIHVAGTNGKGSVSHMLASVLQAAGYKVGLYTSPHLIDFRERIKVNGKMIEKSFVLNFIQQNHAIFEKLKPSFFEMTVAMAFSYFADKKINIAVVEVGLGGRLDSTNIISPELTIITNIGFDHTQFLGHTLTDIAGEKAGIIKQNTPIIIGEKHSETKDVFIEKALDKLAPLFFAEDIYHFDYALQTTEEHQQIHLSRFGNALSTPIDLDLLGHYQHKNILSVLTTLEILRKNLIISDVAMAKGLSKVQKISGLVGRWQIISRNPLTICDTGHNEDGIKQVVEQIYKYPFKKLHFIYGAVNDKNIDKILSLLPKEAEYYFTQASILRALEVDILYKKARLKGLKGSKYDTVKKAFRAAKNKAESSDFIFVGGSSFIVADLLNNGE